MPMASLPSNLKIRSANLRLPSQISEVESRIEFGDWIFNHSDDSSAATPKAGSNAITESVCNEDDIVSSVINGIDKESKLQHEQDVVRKLQANQKLPRIKEEHEQSLSHQYNHTSIQSRTLESNINFISSRGR